MVVVMSGQAVLSLALWLEELVVQCRSVSIVIHM